LLMMHGRGALFSGCGATVSRGSSGLGGRVGLVEERGGRARIVAVKGDKKEVKR